MRNPKRFQNVWISCVDGSVITAFHSVCESVRSPLCTVQEFWRVGGNNKPSCVFRKGAGGGGVAHRGIFGIVQHHSSLVQDAFFPEVWPLCQTNHCQRKGDHHTLDEKEGRTKKKSQKNLHTGGGGVVCHPACNRLNIYKWMQSVNIEAKSSSQVCVSWAQSLQFNECLCAQSYNTSLSLSLSSVLL